jgi:LPPG:FO 2-phospho-L-lactate transferase
MAELGVEPSAALVAAHYRGIIDGFVLDRRDIALAASIGVTAHAAETLMQTLADRMALAREVLSFATRLTPGERRHRA